MASRFFSFLALSLSKGLFFVFSHTITAQETVNLVPNPSFEEFENGCPIDLNEPPSHWSWWRNSPNSFSTCVEPQNLLDSLGWAPWTGFGTQIPSDGESFCGFYAFSPSPTPETQPNFREYLGCELEEPMEIGITYYVSFKVSMGYYGNYYNVWWASNRIGAFFTSTAYSYNDNPMPIPNFAHVYTEEIISDTTNWIIIEGSIVADSAYSHMALGVFFEYDLLETMIILPPNPPPTAGLGAYYFVDDVCVSKFPNCQFVTGNEVISMEFDVKIFPNPASSTVIVHAHEVLSGIRLYDSSGKLVLLKAFQTNEVILDVSMIESGFYLIEALFKDKKTKRERLVIVR